MSQQRCRPAELTIVEDGSRVIATAVWDDHDSYSRWLDHPDRARFGAATADLLNLPLSGGMTGARFLIAHLATPRGEETGRGEVGR